MSAFARLVAGVVLVAAAVVAPGCGPALESEVYHANYELVGQHLGARCEDCHDPGAALAAVDTACVSCHRGALDEHELVMGGLSHNAGHGCEECHTPEGWPVEQEHGFFPLTGSHDARLGPFGTLDYETEKCWTCHTTGDYTLELDAKTMLRHAADRAASSTLTRPSTFTAA